LADPFTAYAVNWEAYATNGPNRPFTNCRSITNNIDACTTNGSNSPLVIPTDTKKRTA